MYNHAKPLFGGIVKPTTIQQQSQVHQFISKKGVTVNYCIIERLVHLENRLVVKKYIVPEPEWLPSIDRTSSNCFALPSQEQEQINTYHGNPSTTSSAGTPSSVPNQAQSQERVEKQKQDDTHAFPTPSRPACNSLLRRIKFNKPRNDKKAIPTTTQTDTPVSAAPNWDFTPSTTTQTDTPMQNYDIRTGYLLSIPQNPSSSSEPTTTQSQYSFPEPFQFEIESGSLSLSDSNSQDFLLW